MLVSKAHASGDGELALAPIITLPIDEDPQRRLHQAAHGDISVTTGTFEDLGRNLECHRLHKRSVNPCG